MKVTIKKVGINGEGIGYIDRLPVFVPQALIDEEIDVRVIDKSSRYATGEVNRIYQKSKNRIEPKCPLQHVCGGCPLMIARYPAQLQYKYEILKQSLIKYAQVNPRLIENVMPSEDVFEYRNQFKMPCAMEDGYLSNGLFMPNSNYFLDVPKCWVHQGGLEKLRQMVIRLLDNEGYESYDHREKTGIRNLIMRGFDGRYQCTIVTGNDTLEPGTIERLMKLPGMFSLWQSIHTVKKTPDVFGPKMIHLSGEKQLSLQIDGIQLHISPRSFFQLNTSQASVLYQKIASLVKGKKKLIVEAYSGIGAISLYLKDKADEIIGIESIKDAVINANENARRNGCDDHVSFLCDDAANKLTYISKNRDIDMLIVDPPRAGLDDAMLECILRSKIKEIIYISCNPATLGKNLSALSNRYQVKTVQPLDMFPHTAHVETVVLLQRR